MNSLLARVNNMGSFQSCQSVENPLAIYTIQNYSEYHIHIAAELIKDHTKDHTQIVARVVM